MAEAVAAQRLEVLDVVAQRRQVAGQDVDAVVEVLAEPLVVDERAEVLVGGGDDPRVGEAVADVADASELASLEDSEELALAAGRHLGDLVEEQGAVVGQLEAAGAVLVCSCERAFGVAEQLALEEGFGEGSAVDGLEGAFGPGARVVDGPGHELLARAALADEQDAGVEGGGFLDEVE